MDYTVTSCMTLFQISAKRFWPADCSFFTPSCVRLNAHLPPSLPRLFRVVLMKSQERFCAISTPCFILKTNEYFGITPPSPTSFLLKHGQTSTSIRRTLRFHVMKQPTTVSLVNLASVLWSLSLVCDSSCAT